MMDIPEICLHICQYLSDRNVIQFLSIRKNLHPLKNKIYYYDCHEYIKIKDLSYFNNFMNIHTTSYLSNHLPIHLKHLIIKKGNTSDIGNIVFPEGLEKLNMKIVSYDYFSFEFPKSLKCLMMPLGYDYQQKQTFYDMTLEKIGVSSFAFSFIYNKIPKTINNIILYGTCFLDKYMISDNITKITIEFADNISELDAIIPPCVKYLKIKEIVCCPLDINPFINRDITLVLNRKYKNIIEKITHSPDFKVKYFD